MFGTLKVSEAIVQNNIFSPSLSFTETLVYEYESTTVSTPDVQEVSEIDFTGQTGATMNGKYFKIYPVNFTPESPDDVYFWYGDFPDLPPSLGPEFGTDVKVLAAPANDDFALYAATRLALIDTFGEGSIFDYSAEGGTVLTITNVTSGDATDPLNDPTSPAQLVVTQQGSTGSNVVTANTVVVTPRIGPFDYTTLQIKTCPALGNITGIDMMSGNVSYVPIQSPGLDTYQYTLTDTQGLTRTVNQRMSQVATEMPPMLNNHCSVETESFFQIGSQTFLFGPYPISHVVGTDPIDWTTLKITRFQHYLPPESGPGFSGFSCGTSYPFGTSDQTPPWSFNPATFDQTPPYAQDEGPPLQDPTEVNVSSTNNFSEDSVSWSWIDNEDGTFSVRMVDGSFGFDGDVQLNGFGMKVMITVEDTVGRLSNELVAEYSSKTPGEINFYIIIFTNYFSFISNYTYTQETL